MIIHQFIKDFPIPHLSHRLPWDLVSELPKILAIFCEEHGGIFVHPEAHVDPRASISGPAYISAGCFVGPNAVIRNGVWLGEQVSIGAGVEVKQSIICGESAIAHFNFIGDSLIGHRVNLEAGAIIANHFNERENKMISVMLDGNPVETGVTKFGAVVGDDCKIGANAVLSPGTILTKGTVVNRLQLVDQSWQSNIQ
jgi:UDP-N-acetylglucosamine diphosphorylase / glucose-1-phosphate thymidylyltransferase / UDP-N-acetylgalactosamine diphosphorylase / glucosamine-1-phosphate N-acetyltransferase / galactosamine-1-phosphate N-acetyltransferase